MTQEMNPLKQKWKEIAKKGSSSINIQVVNRETKEYSVSKNEKQSSTCELEVFWNTVKRSVRLWVGKTDWVRGDMQTIMQYLISEKKVDRSENILFKIQIEQI